jgi:hypothetical protein
MMSFDNLRFLFSGGRKEHIFQLYDLIRPQTYPGLKKIRIGNREADGGYVMADDFEGIDGALSLGIGHDISWDLEMCQHGVDIYQYDHTVEAPDAGKDNPRLHFHQCGICGSEGQHPKMKTIGEVLSQEMAHHTGDLILKIDIDGYEWEVFEKMPVEILQRFRQICIEIHTPLGRPSQSDRRLRNLGVLRKLNSIFAPVHLHANNASPPRVFCGYEVPKLLEITYIRRSGQPFTHSQESFPSELDVTNVTSLPEINIGEILARSKRTS